MRGVAAEHRTRESRDRLRYEVDISSDAFSGSFLSRRKLSTVIESTSTIKRLFHLNEVRERYDMPFTTRRNHWHINQAMAKIQERDSAVRVASITAKQAIIVALITAAAGLAGAYVAQHGTPSAAVNRSVKVTAVDSPDPGAIRVVIEVNGQAYSYPSRVLWADVSDHMSQESFPVPSDALTYSVHISAYFRDANGGKVRFFQTQEVKNIPRSILPTNSDVRLYEVDSESFHRGISSLQVGFSLY